ncbi:MAG: hypothetical protein PHS09_03700 [Candidatus Omnitrophica bacterium]|jgi:spore coat polysaccharide biosynthesis predicted glycosyltransferase SpsG|nr:hypothetical protein [Candidatus Omnitrophota bacterium]MDD5512153.1 hypothetical protein [Candidatus Omnitrophota bacterium]
MNKILFRADAGEKSGTGDLYSLLYLSQYFRGWKKYFICKKTPQTQSILDQYKIKDSFFISPRFDRRQEVDRINQIINREAINAFFFEVTNGPVDYLKKVQAQVKGCIDFWGRIPDNLDLVINWDVESHRLYLPEKFPKTKFLLGPEYVVLKKDMLRAAILNGKFKPARCLRNILVFFGGFDKSDFTFRTVELFERLAGSLRIRVILGAGYTDKCRKKLLDFLRRKNINRISVYQNVLEMKKHYLWADAFVGAGGLSLFEAMAMNLPAAVVSTYGHQKRRCKWFKKMNAIVYLGGRSIDENKLKQFLFSSNIHPLKFALRCDEIPNLINERLNLKT